MIIRTQEDVTGAVLSEIARAGDPRFREIMSSLVRHLHAFAREVKLTEAEFQAAASDIVAIGQKSSETHNEAVLMAGSLGLSTLVCLLNNGNHGATETTANLLGPLSRAGSPPPRERPPIGPSPTPGAPAFVPAWSKHP